MNIQKNHCISKILCVMLTVVLALTSIMVVSEKNIQKAQTKISPTEKLLNAHRMK